MIIKNKIKKIIIILISIVLLFLIIIAIKDIYTDYKKTKELEKLKEVVIQYNSIEQFNNIQEVALYLDCELLEIEELENEELKYNIYLKIKKTPEEDNVEVFYEKLIQYSAHSLKYENFYLIDKEKNIQILVMCNKEKELVTTYYINGIQNYFLNKKSQENIDDYKNIEKIQVNIQSEILNNLVKNNWIVPNNLGTIDSIFNNYNIYFDEGFEIRKVNNKVFNIIFKTNYKDKIVNNITFESTQDEIINELGSPQFKVSNIIGYKCENMYIFFNDTEISIYPIIEFDSNDIVGELEKFVEEKDIQKTIIEIKNIWKDYNMYEYSTNSMVLQYATKGIEFVYGTENKNGIYLYNNYTGKINQTEMLSTILENKVNLPENIYYLNSDLIFDTELKRIQNKYDLSYNMPSEIVPNISTKFKILLEKNDDTYSIKFLSIDRLNPNCELNVDIIEGIWFDDYNFVYILKNKGIYVYNLETRSSKCIKEKTKDEEKFDIKDIDENNLYYDDTYIKLEL